MTNPLVSDELNPAIVPNGPSAISCSGDTNVLAPVMPENCSSPNASTIVCDGSLVVAIQVPPRATKSWIASNSSGV